MGDPVDLNKLIDQLRQLSDHDRAVAYAQSLSPDQATATRQQLRDSAAKLLGDTTRATDFAETVRLDAFTGTDGKIDPAKVQDALTKIGAIAPTPAGDNGQRSFDKGAAGKAEAARRFGTQAQATPRGNTAPPPGMPGPVRLAGQGGRDEAAKRFGDMVLGKRGDADGQAIGIY